MVFRRRTIGAGGLSAPLLAYAQFTPREYFPSKDDRGPGADAWQEVQPC